jgi:hypothetical protein
LPSLLLQKPWIAVVARSGDPSEMQSGSRINAFWLSPMNPKAAAIAILDLNLCHGRLFVSDAIDRWTGGVSAI